MGLRGHPVGLGEVGSGGVTAQQGVSRARKGKIQEEVRAEMTQFSSRIIQNTLAGHRKAFNSGFWKCHFPSLRVQPPNQEVTLLRFLDHFPNPEAAPRHCSPEARILSSTIIVMPLQALDGTRLPRPRPPNSKALHFPTWFHCSALAHTPDPA